MPDDIDRKLVDKRVVQRYLKKGRLDEKDYERHMKSLPDLADQAVPIESDLDDEDFEDEADEPEVASGTEGPKEP
jgi:hypothetical protein